MPRLILILFAALLAGCSLSPTPQDRYNTTLDIVEKELRRLEATEAMFKKEFELRRHDVFDEYVKKKKIRGVDERNLLYRESSEPESEIYKATMDRVKESRALVDAQRKRLDRAVEDRDVAEEALNASR